MNRFLASSITVVAPIVFAAGCGTPEPAPEPGPAAETLGATAQDQPAAQGDALQTRLIDHMSRARAADAQAFRQTFPQHRDLVNEMLNDCRRMMRDMNMTPPRQFTEMETALERDLQRIPSLSDAELESLLPQHLDHVQAVIDMRQDMMDDM